MITPSLQSLIRCFSSAFLCVTISCFSYLAYAQTQQSTSPENAYECTGVKLEEVDPDSMTKAEKLAMLDQALFDSIDRYSTCIGAVQDKMGQGGGGGSGGSGSAGGSGSGGGSGSSGSGQGEGSSESESDSEATGSQGAPQSAEQTAQAQQQNGPVEEIASQGQANEFKTTKTKSADADDKSKKLIVPPKNNDTIVCTMLYEAITSEADETTKADLTVQYQDYECGR